MSPSPSSPEATGTSVEPSAAHRREGRAARWGAVISILVHVLLIAVYPFLMDRISPELPQRPVEESRDPESYMEIVLLVEPDDEEEDAEPVEVVEEIAEEETAVEVEVPVVDEAEEEQESVVEEEAVVDAEEAEERELSVAERLRPGDVDPRLWLPLDSESLQLTDMERAQLLVHGMIRNWNDSMAVAEALRSQALDWTYTDDDGRRWGVSPGTLHLGDFSIPLPVTFDVPPGMRDELRRRQWIYDDIARGAASAEKRELWSNRAREIRRRLDEERDGNEGSGNPP
ncbi:MAG: hypothetical protein WD120_01540 [Gemmatimonadota bacterium]